MKPARPTILLLMACVVVAAADFAWLRYSFEHARSIFGFEPIGLDLGVMPMLSVIVVCLAHTLSRRFRVGPFLAGFVRTAIVVQAAYLAACSTRLDWSTWLWTAYNATMSPAAEAAIDASVRRVIPALGRFGIAQFLWAMVVLSAPQLCLAILGGIISVRHSRARRAKAGPPNSLIPSAERRDQGNC